MKKVRIDNLILRIEKRNDGKFVLTIDHGFGNIEYVDEYKNEQEALQFIVVHLAMTMGIDPDFAELSMRASLSDRIPLQHA